LRGEVKVMLRQDQPRPVRPERPDRGRITVALPAGASIDSDLYEALRLWRLAEAKGQGIPPYVIFHDSVLRDLAAMRPSSLDELAQIKGVGASKLERYGRRVLGVLTAQLPDGLAKRGAASP
jgi:ATP-dependent DNA helicase RecQ